MKKLWLFLPILLFCGCAALTSKQTPLIEVGNPDQLKGCQLLKTYTGPVSYRMWGTPYIGNFKNEALNKAEKIGATHVLWRAESDGLESTAVLKAYKCPINPDDTWNNEENSGEE